MILSMAMCKLILKESWALQTATEKTPLMDANRKSDEVMLAHIFGLLDLLQDLLQLLQAVKQALDVVLRAHLDDWVVVCRLFFLFLDLPSPHIIRDTFCLAKHSISCIC